MDTDTTQTTRRPHDPFGAGILPHDAFGAGILPSDVAQAHLLLAGLCCTPPHRNALLVALYLASDNANRARLAAASPALPREIDAASRAVGR